jgi:hypothetical protein
MKDHQKKNKSVHRRAFLKTLAASGGAAALAGCAATKTPGAAGDGAAEVTLDLTQPDNRALAAVGGMLLLEANPVDSKGLLLYRAGEHEVRAFSRKCTHLGCVIGGFEEGISIRDGRETCQGSGRRSAAGICGRPRRIDPRDQRLIWRSESPMRRGFRYWIRRSAPGGRNGCGLRGTCRGKARCCA